jgi:hypothetical protein
MSPPTMSAVRLPTCSKPAPTEFRIVQCWLELVEIRGAAQVQVYEVAAAAGVDEQTVQLAVLAFTAHLGWQE